MWRLAHGGALFPRQFGRSQEIFTARSPYEVTLGIRILKASSVFALGFDAEYSHIYPKKLKTLTEDKKESVGKMLLKNSALAPNLYPVARALDYPWINLQEMQGKSIDFFRTLQFQNAEGRCVIFDMMALGWELPEELMALMESTQWVIILWDKKADRDKINLCQSIQRKRSVNTSKWVDAQQIHAQLTDHIITVPDNNLSKNLFDEFGCAKLDYTWHNEILLVNYGQDIMYFPPTQTTAKKLVPYDNLSIYCGMDASLLDLLMAWAQKRITQPITEIEDMVIHLNDLIRDFSLVKMTITYDDRPRSIIKAESDLAVREFFEHAQMLKNLDEGNSQHPKILVRKPSETSILGAYRLLDHNRDMLWEDVRRYYAQAEHPPDPGYTVMGKKVDASSGQQLKNAWIRQLKTNSLSGEYYMLPPSVSTVPISVVTKVIRDHDLVVHHLEILLYNEASIKILQKDPAQETETLHLTYVGHWDSLTKRITENGHGKNQPRVFYDVISGLVLHKAQNESAQNDGTLKLFTPQLNKPIPQFVQDKHDAAKKSKRARPTKPDKTDSDSDSISTKVRRLPVKIPLEGPNDPSDSDKTPASTNSSEDLVDPKLSHPTIPVPKSQEPGPTTRTRSHTVPKPLPSVKIFIPSDPKSLIRDPGKSKELSYVRLGRGGKPSRPATPKPPQDVPRDTPEVQPGPHDLATKWEGQLYEDALLYPTETSMQHPSRQSPRLADHQRQRDVDFLSEAIQDRKSASLTSLTTRDQTIDLQLPTATSSDSASSSAIVLNDEYDSEFEDKRKDTPMIPKPPSSTSSVTITYEQLQEQNMDIICEQIINTNRHLESVRQLNITQNDQFILEAQKSILIAQARELGIREGAPVIKDNKGPTRDKADHKDTNKAIMEITEKIIQTKYDLTERDVDLEVANADPRGKPLAKRGEPEWLGREIPGATCLMINCHINPHVCCRACGRNVCALHAAMHGCILGLSCKFGKWYSNQDHDIARYACSGTGVVKCTVCKAILCIIHYTTSCEHDQHTGPSNAEREDIPIYRYPIDDIVHQAGDNHVQADNLNIPISKNYRPGPRAQRQISTDQKTENANKAKADQSATAIVQRLEAKQILPPTSVPAPERKQILLQGMEVVAMEAKLRSVIPPTAPVRGKRPHTPTTTRVIPPQVVSVTQRVTRSSPTKPQPSTEVPPPQPTRTYISRRQRYDELVNPDGAVAGGSGYPPPQPPSTMMRPGMQPRDPRFKGPVPPSARPIQTLFSTMYPSPQMCPQINFQPIRIPRPQYMPPGPPGTHFQRPLPYYASYHPPIYPTLRMAAPYYQPLVSDASVSPPSTSPVAKREKLSYPSALTKEQRQQRNKDRLHQAQVEKEQRAIERRQKDQEKLALEKKNKQARLLDKKEAERLPWDPDIMCVEGLSAEEYLNDLEREELEPRLVPPIILSEEEQLARQCQVVEWRVQLQAEEIQPLTHVGLLEIFWRKEDTDSLVDPIISNLHSIIQPLIKAWGIKLTAVLEQTPSEVLGLERIPLHNVLQTIESLSYTIYQQLRGLLGHQSGMAWYRKLLIHFARAMHNELRRQSVTHEVYIRRLPLIIIKLLGPTLLEREIVRTHDRAKRRHPEMIKREALWENVQFQLTHDRHYCLQIQFNQLASQKAVLRSMGRQVWKEHSNTEAESREILLRAYLLPFERRLTRTYIRESRRVEGTLAMEHQDMEQYFTHLPDKSPYRVTLPVIRLRRNALLTTTFIIDKDKLNEFFYSLEDPIRHVSESDSDPDSENDIDLND